MKLARFHLGDGPVKLGRVDGDEVVEIGSVAGESLIAILPRLDDLRPELERADGPRHPLQQVILDPPVDAPQKYLAIGMNYREHAKEAAAAGIPIPKNQLWFNKQVSCINSPFGDVIRPRVSEQLDYEVELALVISRPARHIAAEDAFSVVGGYLVANDVSVRDWLNARSPTFTLGKSFDTHGPIGPWLTTADEVGDPYGLRMRLTVNGEERQSWTTDDMIHDIGAQIAELTTVMTLLPGDIIATGTPAGIGAPTKNWLRPGDVVRAEIERLGAIENRVVDEAPA